jgi:ABC-type antimicrobial peptide transport system permease subunit
MVELLELALVLVLIVTAANLLVSTVDGMMERRRSLAVLSAIGVAPGTLRRSILVQVAVPLATSLVLGVPAGLAVTRLLFKIADQPVSLPVQPLLITAAAAGAMVLLVTAAAFPWVRIVRRPELLRTE